MLLDAITASWKRPGFSEVVDDQAFFNLVLACLVEPTSKADGTRVLAELGIDKADGWDYGPRTIYYEATIAESFPGGEVPSPATIARLLTSVGQVDASPKKRPKSSYIPFVRATAMALWQLDAFEYDLADGQTITIYQLIDDSTRFDVGTDACARDENSADAKAVLAGAIDTHGPPQEVLSNNSLAFNQLRQGTIGAVKTFLASKVYRRCFG